MKRVLRAWGQLNRGLEVMAVSEMRFEILGVVQKGF